MTWPESRSPPTVQGYDIFDETGLIGVLTDVLKFLQLVGKYSTSSKRKLGKDLYTETGKECVDA